MAAERADRHQVRLFVALDLPDRVREGVAAWQREALGDPALRAMRPESLHVTLCFLGQLDERTVPRLGELVAQAAKRPVQLRFDPQASAMPKGRPQLFALGGESAEATALQAELSAVLVAERFYRPEKRGFWPHVTVARVRSERLPPERGKRRGKGRPRRVKTPPAELPKALTEPFDAVRVALYRSDLKPAGAEYVSLAGVDLPSRSGTQKR
jgi:RNA 2',3'-cyclic 3'-phosphodiesterase